MILPILTWPNPWLTRPTRMVRDDELGTEELHNFCYDLGHTMTAHRGLGLAATQVGDERRVLAFLGHPGDPSSNDVMVNPSIVDMDGQRIEPEGCLSFPGVTWPMPAPVAIRLRFWSADGSPMDMVFRDDLARCLFHEVEHLAGRTMVSRLSAMQRKLFLRAYEKTGKRRAA